MKKAYALLISIIIVMAMISSSDIGTAINFMSLTIRAVALLLAFILPVSLLLYLISIDTKVKRKWRTVARIGVVLLIVTFLATLISEAI